MATKNVNAIVSKTVIEAKRDTYTALDGEVLIIKKLNGDTYFRIGNGTTAGGVKPLIEDQAQLPSIPFSKLTTLPTTLAEHGITDGVTAANLQSAIDNAIAGFNWKNAVRAATTANITLSGAQTVDGVALVAGNRVLVKDQTTASANGIYVVASGAWARAADMDAAAEFKNAVVTVAEGTSNADSMWQVTTDGTITVGSTAISWGQMYIKANVGSADKLSTARTITLGGDASGSVSFDGSANVTLTVAVADDSHAHSISTVSGLQAALDAKSAEFDAIVATPIV